MNRLTDNLLHTIAIVATAAVSSVIGTLSGHMDGPVVPTPASPHAQLGDPVRREVVIRRGAYDVQFDGVRRNPVWVEYRITPADLVPTVDRPSMFAADRMLPERFRVYPQDYDRTGYDRGHMAPSADLRRNQSIAFESMSMSNIAPQTPGLNRKAWRLLEEHIRELVKESDEAIVVTGPAFESRHCTIGDTGDIVLPGGFWKAVALRNGTLWRVRCWYAGQGDGELPIDRLRVSQLHIEQIIGFELFPKLELDRDRKQIVSDGARGRHAPPTGMTLEPAVDVGLRRGSL